jgi:hypothetical protein
MSNRKEFIELLEASGLQKKRLAAMIDKTPISVNRWVSEGKTAVEPPLLVLQFLRSYVMLPEAKRAILRDDRATEPEK